MTGGSRDGCGSAAVWRRGRRNQSSTRQRSPTGNASQLKATMICMNMEDLDGLRFSSYLQHGEERLLRDFHTTQLFHALLALFLFLEQLALARDIAAVAFGEHVLAQRLHGGARDDRAAARPRP